MQKLQNTDSQSQEGRQKPEHIKHSPTSSQVDMNPHTKDKFMSLPVSNTTYPAFSKKNYKTCQKGKNTQSEETKHSSEPDIIQILELSGKEFQITMINMLSALMEKVDTMQEQMV